MLKTRATHHDGFQMSFFADTNICDKWASDQTVNRNWLDAKARLETQGENYVSCP
jgi:hypothetical protein